MARESSADAELRLSYRPDDEWTGQLRAVVRSGAFSGAGSAWFSPQTIEDEFIARLRQFPLSELHPPVIRGGFFSKETPGSLAQCHVGISVRPYDRRGALLVQAELATETWNTADEDQQQSIIVRFLTEYEAVGIFASHFEELLHAERELAVLTGKARIAAYPGP